MHTDIFLQAADWHRRQGLPGQDSAAALVDGDRVTLAVADGCSSGEGSEFGAMAVVRSIVNAGNHLPLMNLAASDLRRWQVLGNAADGAMLATAVRLLVDGDSATASFLGDGIVGAAYPDGSHWVAVVEWRNLPPYPWYAANGQMSRWQAMHPQGTVTVSRSGQVLECAIDPASPEVAITLPPGWETAWIGSDGWTALGQSPESIAREATAFKTVQGTFLKRRLGRWLGQLQRNGISPADDLAMASVTRGKASCRAST